MLQQAVPEIPTAIKGQNPCLGPRGCTDSQGPEPLSGPRGLHWQSKTRTPVWAQGGALTVKDQNPCLGPRGCTDSQRPEPLSGPRGLHWQRPEPLSGSRGLHRQSKTRTPVWVQEVALTVNDQNPCLGPGGCTNSQGPQPLSRSRGLHWQSRTTTPAWVQGVALTVKDHNPCLGPGGCIDSQGPQPLSGSRGLPHSCAHCRTYKCSGTHHYDFGNFNTGVMSRHKLTIAESNPETWNSYHKEHFASAPTVLLMTIMCQWWHCE